MRNVKIQLYRFKELGAEAKQKVIKKYIENHDVWLEDEEEYIKEMIERVGLTDIELQYRLSYSQGDGLSFSAYDNGLIFNVMKRVLGKGKYKTAKIIADNCVLFITGNEGRYCFASKSDAGLVLDSATMYYTNIEKAVQDAESRIQAMYMDMCKHYENMLYKEIEWQKSEEYAIEYLEDCETEYLENGDTYLF